MNMGPEIPLHRTVMPGSAAATLKATTESQRVYLGPSEAVLLKLLDDVEGGYEAFFVIERLEDPTGETYLQVLLDGRDFLEEYRWWPGQALPCAHPRQTRTLRRPDPVEPWHAGMEGDA